MHRRGEWTLGEKDDGIYLIKRRGHLRAKVLTGEFEAGETLAYLIEEGIEDVIEVESVEGVRETFREFAAAGRR